jgi:phosphate-selective porin OprO/OprP
MKNTFTKVALAALATAAGATAAHAQTPAAPTHSTSWTGTVGEDRYGDARFKMRGRFQYDLYSPDWDSDPDGDDDAWRSYVRRAFLGVQGRLTEHWRYKVDFVLTPSAAEVNVDDAFLEYVGDDWSIVIGEHNVTSPLEDRISSLDIPFAERSSIINAFGYGRLAGIGFLTGGANWSASAALQGESLNSTENFSNDEATAISGRFTFAPIFDTTPEGTTLVHLGISARQRDTGDNGDNNYQVRPLNGRNDRWIITGGIGDTDTTYGVEGAVQFGPFGAQAEYMMLDGDDSAGDSFEASGYYVDVYWSLTGESRQYRGNQGSFGAIVPRRAVSDGGPGHWMLSGRYDYIDLSDEEFPVGTRGEQSAYAVAVDWVPIDHVRFKLNYAVSDMDRTGAATVDNEAQIVTLRTQFDF